MQNEWHSSKDANSLMKPVYGLLEKITQKGIEVPHAIKKTIEKKEQYVNYLDEDGSLNLNITKDDATYPAGKTVAATIFRPESSEAYCKSCGEPLGFLDQPITGSGATVTYKLMNGSWIYTDRDIHGDATTVYYIDVTETEKDGLKAVLHKTVVATNVTRSVDAAAVKFEDKALEDNKVRTLALGQVNGSYYAWISQDDTGAWTLKTGSTVTYADAVDVDLTKDGADSL